MVEKKGTGTREYAAAAETSWWRARTAGRTGAGACGEREKRGLDRGERERRGAVCGGCVRDREKRGRERREERTRPRGE